MPTRQTRRGSGNAARTARLRKRAPAGGAVRWATASARTSVWTPRRIVLLVLLLVPFGMIVWLLRQPLVKDIWLEMAFYVFGVPIAVINMWEWGSIRVLERSSAKRTKE